MQHTRVSNFSRPLLCSWTTYLESYLPETHRWQWVHLPLWNDKIKFIRFCLNLSAGINGCLFLLLRNLKQLIETTISGWFQTRSAPFYSVFFVLVPFGCLLITRRGAAFTWMDRVSPASVSRRRRKQTEGGRALRRKGFQNLSKS